MPLAMKAAGRVNKPSRISITPALFAGAQMQALVKRSQRYANDTDFCKYCCHFRTSDKSGASKSAYPFLI